jgi:hypothetical protein
MNKKELEKLHKITQGGGNKFKSTKSGICSYAALYSAR